MENMLKHDTLLSMVENIILIRHDFFSCLGLRLKIYVQASCPGGPLNISWRMLQYSIRLCPAVYRSTSTWKFLIVVDVCLMVFLIIVLIQNHCLFQSAQRHGRVTVAGNSMVAIMRFIIVCVLCFFELMTASFPFWRTVYWKSNMGVTTTLR